MNGLFKVRHKILDKIFIVYDVRAYRSGSLCSSSEETEFLIYINGNWHYFNADRFEPVE